MAGFEIIVRPVVFPNIRPLPSRSLPPADDPEQGQCVLSGGSGQVIALTHSYSASASSSGGTEIERVYDVARIRPSSGGDSDTYIDVEVMNQVRMKNNDDTTLWIYTPIKAEPPNVEIIQRQQRRTTSQ